MRTGLSVVCFSYPSSLFLDEYVFCQIWAQAVLNIACMDIKQLIESAREALGDKYDKFNAAADDLIGQRDAARAESIGGRKTLKADVDRLKIEVAKYQDTLGVSSVDELEGLPDAKGQAEAAKQFAAQIKRMEKSLSDTTAERDGALSKVREILADAQIAQAVERHQFQDPKLPKRLIRTGLQFEGEQAHYIGDDGKLMAIEDAVALIAKTSPYLLKSVGAGGSGHQQPGGGGSASNPWLKATLNLSDQIAITRDNPSHAASLKQQAEAAA